MANMKKIGRPTFLSLLVLPVMLAIIFIGLLFGGLITIFGFFIWAIFHPVQAKKTMKEIMRSWRGHW